MELSESQVTEVIAIVEEGVSRGAARLAPSDKDDAMQHILLKLVSRIGTTDRLDCIERYVRKTIHGELKAFCNRLKKQTEHSNFDDSQQCFASDRNHNGKPVFRGGEPIRPAARTLLSLEGALQQLPHEERLAVRQFVKLSPRCAGKFPYHIKDRGIRHLRELMQEDAA